MVRIEILDAPSNLGLRPPEPGVVPGCYKAPWALREAGLLADLDVRTTGVVVPPRYDSRWTAGDGDRNADAIAAFSLRLAERLDPRIGRGFFQVVIGGDCSILIGEALALRRRGRYGLVFIDGHGDFRHQGNDGLIAAAGEDLAIVTGRGDERLVDLDGEGPSVRDEDVVVLGIRPDDTFLDELRSLGIGVQTSDRIRDLGVESTVDDALVRLTGGALDGFWIHLDVDVLDAASMPAVDSPAPGGLDFEELADLLIRLAGDGAAVGMDVCIYDPDLDPDLVYGRALASMLNGVLASLVSVSAPFSGGTDRP